MGTNNKNGTGNLKIINRSLQKLLDLDVQERKIHRAQKKELEKIQNIMSRCYDDRDLQEKLEKDREAYNLLSQVKKSINSLRQLLR